MVQQELNTPVVMRLRVALLGVKPVPWRRIEVTTATTLAGLHDVIQAAMGGRTCISTASAFSAGGMTVSMRT